MDGNNGPKAIGLKIQRQNVFVFLCGGAGGIFVSMVFCVGWVLFFHFLLFERASKEVFLC